MSFTKHATHAPRSAYGSQPVKQEGLTLVQDVQLAAQLDGQVGHVQACCLLQLILLQLCKLRCRCWPCKWEHPPLQSSQDRGFTDVKTCPEQSKFAVKLDASPTLQILMLKLGLGTTIPSNKQACLDLLSLHVSSSPTDPAPEIITISFPSMQWP